MLPTLQPGDEGQSKSRGSNLLSCPLFSMEWEGQSKDLGMVRRSAQSKAKTKCKSLEEKCKS